MFSSIEEKNHPNDCKGDCDEERKKELNCGNCLGLPEVAIIKETPLFSFKKKQVGANRIKSYGDIHLFQCPGSYVTDLSKWLRRLCFMAEKTNTLYRAGGLEDQPVWFMEIYEIYLNEVTKFRNRPPDDPK